MQALERLSFAGSQIKETVVAQSRILLFWYCTTYFLLEKNKPKYQMLEAPLEDQVSPYETAEEKEEPLADQVDGKELLEPQKDQILPFILEGL